ncbi:MAG: type II toxin-antitoxin system HipA family toxin [bacterium]
MSRRLEILLYGVPVGEISETGDGRTEFRFLDEYFDLVPRPVLGQKFEDDLRRVHRSRLRERLPDFFANLVPEGRLRELIEQTTGVEEGDDLALLAYVGGDLPGAVTARPFEGEELVSSPPAEVAATELPDEAPDEDVGEGLRFSLAGVQLKLSMLREGERLTLPVHDRSGDWIVKFDSPSFPHLPENEYSMLEWARAAEFDVPECHLHGLDDLDEEAAFLRMVRQLVEPGTRILAIRRYDRTPDGPIHQEDFAQATGLPPAKKYEQIRHEVMAVLVRQFIGEEGTEEYVRRLVLTVAQDNGDAHLKNWSLVYPDRVSAAWSPLYDQVSTVAWHAPRRQLALKLAGVKDFGRIDRELFVRLADHAGLRKEKVNALMEETLARLRDAWGAIGPDLPLAPAHRRAVEDHWARVPLLRSAGGLR